MKTEILYNHIEKDYWNTIWNHRQNYVFRVMDSLDCFAIPQNHGWNLLLEDWEVGQLLGGN